MDLYEVEFRSICEPPVCQSMAPTAFHPGIMHNLPKLTRLPQEDHVIYRQGYPPSELRTIFNQRNLSGWLDAGPSMEHFIEQFAAL